jgi:DNA polymerase III subunit chi
MLKANLYKLSTTPFAKSFPKLIETIVRKNHRVKILCQHEEEMWYWDKILWSASQLSFIPHGTERDDNPGLQPVLLTCDSSTNLNNAEVLFSNTALEPSAISAFKIVVSMLPETEEIAKIDQLIQFFNTIADSVTVFQERNGVWLREK